MGRASSSQPGDPEQARASLALVFLSTDPLTAFVPRALPPMTNTSLGCASEDTLLLLKADGDPEHLSWDTEVTDGSWGVGSARVILVVK